ncbi:MAG: hypothetical protein QXF12_07035 [Candidatus Aenigmatarchaeota archaeon]
MFLDDDFKLLKNNIELRKKLIDIALELAINNKDKSYIKLANELMNSIDSSIFTSKRLSIDENNSKNSEAFKDAIKEFLNKINVNNIHPNKTSEIPTYQSMKINVNEGELIRGKDEVSGPT